MKNGVTAAAMVLLTACIGDGRHASSSDAADLAADGATADTDGTATECHENQDCPASLDRCVGIPSCIDGRCVSGESVACPGTGNPCTDNTCDPETGTCASHARDEGADCDDHDACTLGDRCGGGALAGQCVGEPKRCEAAGECFAIGTCNPLSGVCDTPVQPEGTACQDAPTLGGTGTTAGACHEGTCRRLPVIALGAYHGCAILWDGSVRCWGRNDQGQLGLGNTTDVGDRLGPDVREAPALALTDVSALGLGTEATCAVTAGALKCWGEGFYGALGYGDLENRGDTPATTPDKLPPVDLGPGFEPVAVTVARQGACAVSREGGVKCWGTRTTGYPGIPEVAVPDAPSLAEVGTLQLGAGGDAFAVSALVRGDLHACALASGRIRCWGQGQPTGRGGFEVIGDDEPPSTASILNPGWQAVSLASIYGHGCAASDAGAVYCWGKNDDGALGSGSNVPVTGVVGPLPFTLDLLATKVVTGSRHSCALFTNKRVRCWGDNSTSELGRGDDTSIQAAPETVPVELGGEAVDIAAGWGFTCAVMRDGAIRCWGEGQFGRLGNDDTTNIGDDPSSMPPRAIAFE